MDSKTLKEYTGLNIADRFEGVKKELYLACWNYMHEAFGDNVEFERMRYQVLLCEETRDYLYQPPKSPRYIKGSRPILEKTVENLTADCHSQREKALAILVFIRDLYKKCDGEDYFFGGTEEELIKKGEWYCERVARLMAALCEIAGMPGRIVFHMGHGHLTSEIFLENKWAYFDPRIGLFYLDKAGILMSVDEIIKNIDVIYNQNDDVYLYHSSFWKLSVRQDANYNKYFSPEEIQCIVPYSLADADKYHFEWMPSTIYSVKTRDEAHDKYIQLSKQYFGK